MKDKLEELGVMLVQVDMTDNEDEILKLDLKRAERSSIPVNLVYPADYPARPAILLEELFGPKQALQALERIAPKAGAAESKEPNKVASAKK